MWPIILPTSNSLLPLAILIVLTAKNTLKNLWGLVSNINVVGRMQIKSFLNPSAKYFYAINLKSVISVSSFSFWKEVMKFSMMLKRKIISKNSIVFQVVEKSP
jgi:hypothetical protein